MQLDLEAVRANVRQSSTEDLLDRATVYREGMEVEALDIIERELRERGIDRDALAEHERKRREGVPLDSRGVAWKCYRCRRPATARTWSWQRLWGLLPLFPRRFAWCDEHNPYKPGAPATGEGPTAGAPGL